MRLAAKEGTGRARRWSSLAAVVVVGLVGLGCSHASAPADSVQDARMTEIYAAEAWYAERPEPEREWRGVLREREVTIGPGSRTALRFTLTGDRDAYAVYSANVDPLLEPYLNRAVVVRGRLVDLTSEGFGRELWIGTIRPARAGDQ